MLSVEQVRSRVLKAVTQRPPSPWRLIQEHAIGGLTEVGFSADSAHLLVFSAQGRGVFDCRTGERVARDRSDDRSDWYADNDLQARAVPPISDPRVALSGLWGGGLSAQTSDGWRIEKLQLPWPDEHVLLIPPGAALFQEHCPFTKIAFDTEFRAFGFSPDGKSLILAPSHTLTIYARP